MKGLPEIPTSSKGYKNTSNSTLVWFLKGYKKEEFFFCSIENGKEREEEETGIKK